MPKLPVLNTSSARERKEVLKSRMILLKLKQVPPRKHCRTCPFIHRRT